MVTTYVRGDCDSGSPMCIAIKSYRMCVYNAYNIVYKSDN